MKQLCLVIIWMMQLETAAKKKLEPGSWSLLHCFLRPAESERPSAAVPKTNFQSAEATDQMWATDS